jgi:hypothetical protein
MLIDSPIHPEQEYVFFVDLGATQAEKLSKYFLKFEGKLARKSSVVV